VLEVSMRLLVVARLLQSPIQPSLEGSGRAVKATARYCIVLLYRTRLVASSKTPVSPFKTCPVSDTESASGSFDTSQVGASTSSKHINFIISKAVRPIDSLFFRIPNEKL
jgi:hypothetical protein